MRYMWAAKQEPVLYFISVSPMRGHFAISMRVHLPMSIAGAPSDEHCGSPLRVLPINLVVEFVNENGVAMSLVHLAD